MKKIKIGIAGLGTVGRGVYEILQNQKDLLALRTNCEFEVVAVASRSKKDFVDSKIKFYSNILDLAQDQNVDVVVELMGGYDVAKDLIHSSLKNNKKVVTANKALLAEQGKEILNWVDKYRGSIGFEASVAGANPIIKAFKEGFVANEISEIYAILNGTCNFILTKMKNEKQDYKIALQEAQELGFAEADPRFDVEGNDTAHKIVLLSAIARSSLPNYAQTYIEGINKISIDDINLADELGYKIKLLAVYKNLGDEVQQSVYPALIKNSEKIAQIDGSYNAVLSKGSNFEYNLMVGRGAGGKPTGSAVVADIVDIACERNNSFLFNAESINLKETNIINIKKRCGQYFIVFNFDKNNLSKGNVVEQIFANRINPKQVVFKQQNEDNKDIFVGAILTENHVEKDIIDAIAMVDKSLIDSIKFIRVEQTNF
jgi:homoserine dehydrogenase